MALILNSEGIWIWNCWTMGSNLLSRSENGLVAEEWEVASVTPVLESNRVSCSFQQTDGSNKEGEE